MKNRVFWKGLLASATGAWVGGMIALQMNQYFWWLGMLVGGLVGYVSYEPKECLTQTVRIVRQAFSGITSKSFIAFWKRFGWNFFDLGSLWFLSCCFSYFLIIFVEPKVPIKAFLFATFVILISMILVSFVVSFDSDYPSHGELGKVINPISLIFWYLPRLLIKAIRALPVALRWLGRLIVQVFVAVHSQERWMCLLDAALGSAWGYYWRHAVIGAFAGALFWLVSYQMIARSIKNKQTTL